MYIIITKVLSLFNLYNRQEKKLYLLSPELRVILFIYYLNTFFKPLQDHQYTQLVKIYNNTHIII